MATAIRMIPTLEGMEAREFEREAARVEANPGTVKIDSGDIEIMRKILEEVDLV